MRILAKLRPQIQLSICQRVGGGYCGMSVYIKLSSVNQSVRVRWWSIKPLSNAATRRPSELVLYLLLIIFLLNFKILNSVGRELAVRAGGLRSFLTGNLLTFLRAPRHLRRPFNIRAHTRVRTERWKTGISRFCFMLVLLLLLLLPTNASSAVIREKATASARACGTRWPLQTSTVVSFNNLARSSV